MKRKMNEEIYIESNCNVYTIERHRFMEHNRFLVYRIVYEGVNSLWLLDVKCSLLLHNNYLKLQVWDRFYYFQREDPHLQNRAIC